MNRHLLSIRLLIIIALIILANLLTAGYFRRIDLTQEKRYSLSDLTINTLDSLQYPVLVSVYLEGEFPPQIRAFQDALRTSLLEMQQYAASDFTYEFVDPGANKELMQFFQSKGYVPIPVKVKVSATETRQQYMWPLAKIHYGERDIYVDLVKGATVMTPQGPNINFNRAEADLEYKLLSALRTLMREQGGVVALLQGHGELTVDQIPELKTEIQNGYNLFTFDMARQPGLAISPSIGVLIVLQPTRPFSERDKYELDQYLMRGGRILWVMAQEKVDMDMYRKQATLTQLYDLNLDDMFMQYGCKINYDLIQDRECESTEVFQEGPGGGTFLNKKWPFFPLVYNFPQHPISRNTDAVLLRYAGSIDTFYQAGVRKSVFLQTSPRSRTVQGQQFIDVNEFYLNPPPEGVFNRGGMIAGVLMEGVFESLFAGRQAPVDSAAPAPPTAPFGARNNPISPGAVAVISDGSFVLGKEFQGQRGYMPYDNKVMIMNAIDYLAGDQALTEIRSKDVTVRRLDPEKARTSAGWLRWLNLILPIAAVAGFGAIRAYLRRRRNQRLQA
ncbi:MAG: Gldg family protein [Bacteroidia bacterium]|nr:Gldg family protein [Bacteroidia bacterium]